ncbi:MAG TPA: hypothetical protein VIN05_16045 [Roseovarius sp.]
MKLKTFMMSAAVSALIAGGAVAQTDTTATDGTVAGTADADAAAVMPQFTSISEMTVGDLVGQNVYGPDGDTIGDIDYVVGRDGGGLAVIGIGGFLGLGEYTVGLPLSDFGYDASQQMVTLNTTKEALKEQPEFDESEVESLPDETPLADLVGSADAGGSDAMTDGATDDAMSDDAMSGDSAISDDAAEPDAGADMTDDAATDGMTEDGMADEAPATGDAATDDAPAEAESDMGAEENPVEDTTTD